MKRNFMKVTSKRICLLSAAILCFTIALRAQPTVLRQRVWVSDNKLVKYDKVMKLDTIKRSAGDVITSEKKYKKGSQEFTLLTRDTINSTDSRIELVDKPVPQDIRLTGRATVSVDKEDKSKLHLNYWLEHKVEFEKGTDIVIKEGKKVTRQKVKADSTIRITLIDPKDYGSFRQNPARKKIVIDSIAILSLAARETGNSKLKALRRELAALEAEDVRIDWLKHTDKLIYVMKRNEQTEKYDTAHVYAQKYSKDYYIKLGNREYVGFTSKSIEIGALTIPFKYRFPFEKNKVDISDDFTADLNVGLYVGYTFGRINYVYRKNEDHEPIHRAKVTLGGIFSASRVEIDSMKTLGAETPLAKDEKRAIAVFSPGLGLMLSIQKVRIGFFYGWDIAAGPYAKRWDYNKEGWFGFGVGYNLGLLWTTPK
jgi:hypothetical protein